jgi:signal transduction histidine kinase
MNKLIDKLIVFIFCLCFYLPNVNQSLMIVPILIVIIISAALSYFEYDRFRFVVFVCYLLLCFSQPLFIFFIPLICYDILFFKIKWLWVLALLPASIYFAQTLSLPIALTVSLIGVAFLLKYHTLSMQRIKNDYYQLRDNTKEMSIKLTNKNKELMEKQDYEINLATLNERNRIARDIHDNVGHMLSSSILQIGALLATSKDEKSKEDLMVIKSTLSSAMDAIRNSVHDLHDESIDLYTEIQTLVKNFEFCPVELDYDIETNLEKNLKYCFITVTKEALSNIIHHSNATKASIILREHPALFQLVIQDNGTQKSYESDNGIGLKNISDRVAAFHGNIHISADKGFRIFISIPKK